MSDLNLIKVHLGTSQIAAFALKRSAVSFAKTNGWSPSTVCRAFNRFSLFWIVSQKIGDDVRILKLDGTTVDMPHPGFN